LPQELYSKETDSSPQLESLPLPHRQEDLSMLSRGPWKSTVAADVGDASELGTFAEVKMLGHSGTTASICDEGMILLIHITSIDDSIDVWEHSGSLCVLLWSGVIDIY